MLELILTTADPQSTIDSRKAKQFLADNSPGVCSVCIQKVRVTTGKRNGHDQSELNFCSVFEKDFLSKIGLEIKCVIINFEINPSPVLGLVIIDTV